MKSPLAGLACLALLAAANASALNWNDGDLVAQALTAVPSPTAAASAGQAPPADAPAGQFDSYVLALEWTSAFCEGKNIPECSNRHSGGFDSKNLALHGLWPNRNDDKQHKYGYCGIDAKERALDRAATWCKMTPLSLSKETLSELATVMPGVTSCLHNHEWYKHGSCSGLSPDDFFSSAAALVRYVSTTRLGQFLAQHVGEPVAADDLLSAFEAEFGQGSRKFVTLNCTKARGLDLLLDVRLKLTTPLRPAAELAQMLLPGGGGNCPANFTLDSAPTLAAQ